VALGLAESCSLVVREVQGHGVVEFELDASRLHSAYCLDVCGLRIRADVDTMCAHCADCTCCATTRGAAPTDWYAWWDRALCLADYTSLLNANNALALAPRAKMYDDEMCASSSMEVELECDGGFDLAFLGD